MIEQAPSEIAAAAVRAEVMDSSRQIGVRTSLASSAWPSTSSSGSGCSISSRLNGSSFARCRASCRVYAVFASTWISRSSPNRSRTARTGSTSQPGWIFSLIRTYPAATYPATSSRSLSMEFAMPTETPQGTCSLTAPSSRANDRPDARSSASSTAVSIAALDIQCPLNGSRM